MLIRVGSSFPQKLLSGSVTNCVGKQQFDGASPPNPLPDRGGG